VLQIRKQLKVLLSSKKPSYLTIDQKDTDRIIQVAEVETEDKKHELNVMIGEYPSKSSPTNAFKKAGINIRKGWRQTGFEKETYVQYNLPRADAKHLPYFIHRVFVKFLKADTNYQLSCSVEAFEPGPVEQLIRNAADKIEISVTAGDAPDADKTDVDGSTVSFPALRSTTSMNGSITDARVGNMDENMKQYAVVLDAKGKKFAEADGIAFQVTGKLRIENGKRMLVITDYKKK